MLLADEVCDRLVQNRLNKVNYAFKFQLGGTRDRNKLKERLNRPQQLEGIGTYLIHLVFALTQLEVLSEAATRLLVPYLF